MLFYAEIMTEGKFKVLKASAGSGKTYALVKEFLLLALQYNKPDYYRHILAITFTNAAAAEMKERVLHRLRDFAERNAEVQNLFDEIKEELALEPIELQRRAEATFRHMLHHYGQLSISTIDSFTHRLIRTFARDLRLSHDFSVQMDTALFVEEVVDTCFEKVGVDDEITAYLKQVALDKLEDEGNWTLRNALISFTKEMMKEEATRAIVRLEDLSLADFKTIKQNLFAKRKAFENHLIALANEALALLEKSGLGPDDFWYSGGGSISLFGKILNETFETPGPRMNQFLERENWYKDKKNAFAISAIESIKPQLKKLLEDAVALLQPAELAKYELKGLILRNIYQLGLMSRLHQIADDLKREQNILLIKDFHELINEIVSENEAPFIYERIGNRYKHILFDEFQDTSVLQWNNAIPLVQNALSENNLSLIVGDGKQSIYRWRGGRAEQFVSLPEVQVVGIHAAAAYVFKMHYHDENLEKNFRSARAIIQFNNALYEKLIERIPSARNVYEGHKQEEVKNSEGYVCISKIESKNKTEGMPLMLDEIVKQVRSCIADGYRANDIAILTRKGASEGGVVAAKLKEVGFDVETKESFLLCHSPKVRAVMGYLSYTVNEGNYYAAVECARALSDIHPHASFNSFVTEYMKRDANKRHELHVDLRGWLAHHFGEKMDTETMDSAHGLAVNLIRYFRISTDTYIEFLLDNIRQRCIVANASLSQLDEWWRASKNKTYITSAPNEKAVQVMTVHKSKGLQFPVVIYPRFATSVRYDDMWIATDEKEFGLTTALVKRKSVDETTANLWPKEFAEEENKLILDDLNLCYVATTRAEQRLYVVTEKRNTNTTLSKVLEGVIENDFAENKTSDSIWEFGTPEKTESKATKEAVDVMQHSFGVSNPFVVRAKPLYTGEVAESIGYGNMLHACFALIATVEDAERAIHKTLGDFTADEKEEPKNRLRADVERIVNGEKTKHWFNAFEELFLERELLTAEGSTLRPDRVMVFADRIEVVDFKTGAPRNEHQQQLDEYVKVLEEIYDKEVVGEVVYVGEG